MNGRRGQGGAVYTTPGGRLPQAEAGEMSPVLLYHRWHGYDDFVGFKQHRVKRRFLEDVAGEIGAVNRDEYGRWYCRFDRASRALGADVITRKSTAWRLVCGWATNPALETGLTLHPFLGFPLVPGSAVKGLVHRVAEDELAPKIPQAPEELPATPPDELVAAVAEGRLIRAIFGSLSSQQGRLEEAGVLVLGAPGTLDRLNPWGALLARARREDPEGELPEGWAETAASIELLLSGVGTGALVSWLDAVPAEACFKRGDVVEVDVLTPHYGGYYDQARRWRQQGAPPEDAPQPLDAASPGERSGPNPILFLAVAPGVAFEFRARFRTPVEVRSDEEREEREERRAALSGWSQEQIRRRVSGWLGEGLAEVGLGAKTSAGYGYFGAPPEPGGGDDVLGLPEIWELPRREERGLSPEELWVREQVPEELDAGDVAERLDVIRAQATPAQARAAARRILEFYAEEVEAWRSRLKRTFQDRVEWLEQAASEEES